MLLAGENSEMKPARLMMLPAVAKEISTSRALVSEKQVKSTSAGLISVLDY
jgi:hypothetical protein